jgi:hypothetical protein
MNVTDEAKIDAIQKMCREKAEDAKYYINELKSRNKWLEPITTFIRVFGLLIPVTLAIAVMSSYFEEKLQKQLVDAAIYISGIQLFLSFLSYGFGWETKLAAYQKLVATLTRQRDEFLQMNGKKQDNASNLSYSFDLESLRFRVTLEDISQYNIIIK